MTKQPFRTPPTKPFRLAVISGGQDGADIAGLDAAQFMGVMTGGWMTASCKTQSGCHPEYLEKYNMRCMPQDGYAERTLQNVKDSDITIRFASEFSSPGEICTMRAIQKYQRLHKDVHLYGHNEPLQSYEMAQYIHNAIINMRHPALPQLIINIAGNSERTSPGIYQFVHSYVSLMLWYLK